MQTTNRSAACCTQAAARCANSQVKRSRRFAASEGCLAGLPRCQACSSQCDAPPPQPHHSTPAGRFLRHPHPQHVAGADAGPPHGAVSRRRVAGRHRPVHGWASVHCFCSDAIHGGTACAALSWAASRQQHVATAWGSCCAGSGMLHAALCSAECKGVSGSGAWSASRVIQARRHAHHCSGANQTTAQGIAANLFFDPSISEADKLAANISLLLNSDFQVGRRARFSAMTRLGAAVQCAAHIRRTGSCCAYAQPLPPMAPASMLRMARCTPQPCRSWEWCTAPRSAAATS